MQKTSIFGLAALFGLMVSTMPAHAQTISTDIGPSYTSSGEPVQGSSGSFHVVITQESAVNGTDTFQVTLTGNNDGNPSDMPEGQTSPGGNPSSITPKSGIGRISLNFYDASGGLFSTTVASGSTDACTGCTDNLGGPNNVAFGATGGTWTAAAGDTTYYSTADKGAYVAPHGGNTFTGTFSLALGTGSLNSVAISLQDSGQQYNKQVPIVPEPGSLALLLPGLAPLGFLLRRRRPSSDED
jgi:hypothetical protein